MEGGEAGAQEDGYDKVCVFRDKQGTEAKHR